MRGANRARASLFVAVVLCGVVAASCSSSSKTTSSTDTKGKTATTPASIASRVEGLPLPPDARENKNALLSNSHSASYVSSMSLDDLKAWYDKALPIGKA